MVVRPSHKPGKARSLSHGFRENNKVLGDRRKEVSEGDNDTTGETTHGAGCSTVTDCRRRKTVQTIPEHRQDFVFNLGKDRRIRTREHGTAGSRETAIGRVIQRVKGERDAWKGRGFVKVNQARRMSRGEERMFFS